MTQPDQYFPDTAVNALSFADYSATPQEDWEDQIHGGVHSHFSIAELAFDGLLELVRQIPIVGDLIANIIDTIIEMLTGEQSIGGTLEDMALAVQNTASAIGKTDDRLDEALDAIWATLAKHEATGGAGTTTIFADNCSSNAGFTMVTGTFTTLNGVINSTGGLASGYRGQSTQARCGVGARLTLRQPGIYWVWIGADTAQANCAVLQLTVDPKGRDRAEVGIATGPDPELFEPITSRDMRVMRGGDTFWELRFDDDTGILHTFLNTEEVKPLRTTDVTASFTVGTGLLYLGMLTNGLDRTTGQLPWKLGPSVGDLVGYDWIGSAPL